MKCNQARMQLSNFLEDNLAPVLRQGLLKHLSSCAPCKTELRDLQSALRALRSSPREEPPPNLSDAILLAIASIPAHAPRARGPAFLGRKSWIWLTAALFLLSSLLVFQFLAQVSGEKSTRRKIDELEARLKKQGSEERSLAAELARKEEAWGVERKALLVEMRATEKKLQAEEEAGAKALLARELEQGRLRNEMKQLEEKADRQAEEITRLGRSLSASREEAAKASMEVARLEKELSRRAVSSVQGDEGRGTPHLVFRRRGDRLEIQTRGPLDAVVSELFGVAWDETDAELSSLALGALEDLLAEKDAGKAGARSRNEDDSSGFLGQWNRGIAAFASEAGLSGIGQGAAVSAREREASREERLKALEAAWRSRKLGQ